MVAIHYYFPQIIIIANGIHLILFSEIQRESDLTGFIMISPQVYRQLDVKDGVSSRRGAPVSKNCGCSSRIELAVNLLLGLADLYFDVC
jgi:hypothetical protein